jgi:hypothetical protein
MAIWVTLVPGEAPSVVYISALRSFFWDEEQDEIKRRNAYNMCAIKVVIFIYVAMG